jgi:cellobiose phosphorylase
MHIQSPAGLVFQCSDSGAVTSIEVDPIRISMRSASPFSRAGANLYLRKRGGDVAYTPLLGPGSPSRCAAADGGFEARGSWQGLEYACVLQLAGSRHAWQWRVQLENRSEEPLELDVMYVQDVGLRSNAPGLVNEAYVSQYLERRVFDDPQHGCVVACRQNMKESVGYPWLMIACAERAVAACTDGSQFYGPSFRGSGEPEAMRADTLGGELAGEAAIAALQSEVFVVSPGQTHTCAFVATYLPDHEQASSAADLERVPELVRAFEAALPLRAASDFAAPARRRFQHARLLPADDLTQAELKELFGSSWRHVEQADGQLLSFFSDGPRHVVLRAKEAMVERPHGHIMQAMHGYAPHESIMSTTAFACGVFNSHLTQGNTNFNTLLSVCTQPATPALEGQRIVVRLDDGEYLLGVPSAFEIGLNHCRWIYKRGALCLQVCTWTCLGEPRINLDVKVLRGGAVALSVTHQFDELNGWVVAASGADQFTATPRPGSMLAGQFPRAQFRLLINGEHRSEMLDGDDAASSLFVLDVPHTSAFCMSVVGEVEGPTGVNTIKDANAARRADCEDALVEWRKLSRDLTVSGHNDLATIHEILPWYVGNALVHFLTPYGLEQFSGAAWGTRDVCQGPIELLLCHEKYDEAN